MAAEHLTLADLHEAGTVTSLEIVAAIDAYIDDPAAGPYRFSNGYSLDLAPALKASAKFAEMVTRPGPKEKTFRTAVTTVAMAIPLTPP